MATLWGRRWSRSELLAQVGDLSQIAGIRLGEWTEGPERGVRTAEVRTGGGLSFSVLLDRGMDLGPAEFRGVPLAWQSGVGFVHPAFYDASGTEWRRSFGGGLLVGCGLTYLGAADVDAGQSLGMHGRISSLPGRLLRAETRWEGNECSLILEGQVRESGGPMSKLQLSRRITSRLGENTIRLDDTVENLGAEPSPLMVLYHINLGWPLLDAEAFLEAAPHPVRPRDAAAAPGLDAWDHFSEPVPGYREQVFYHDLPARAGGMAEIALVNPRLGLRLAVRQGKETLPNLVQWKYMAAGAYVLGLEPANCGVEGRSVERARGTLRFIAPGETVALAVEIEAQPYPATGNGGITF